MIATSRMIGQTPTSLPTYLQPHLLLIKYELYMALIRFRDNQKEIRRGREAREQNRLDVFVAKTPDLCLSLAARDLTLNN